MCAGNAFCTWKIYDFAEFVQVVEFPFPVRADCEDVDAVYLDVIYLLTDIFLDYDFICITGISYGLDSFYEAVMCVQFATFQVEVVRGYSYNQIVSEFLGPLEKK